MSRIFKAVKVVSDLQESLRPEDYESGKMLLQRSAKLSEESGEVAAEVLKLTGYKKTTKTTREVREDLKEEAIDALITSLDVINHLKMSEDEVVYILEQKLNEWKTKHLEQK